MTYINMREDGDVETVDEFSTKKEALEMLAEYQVAFGHARLYLSTRCTNDWKRGQEGAP